MKDPTTVYRIYLLTIWLQPDAEELRPAGDEQKRENAKGNAKWRFTLEDPRTGQRRSFSTMVALVAAVQAEFAEERSQIEP